MGFTEVAAATRTPIVAAASGIDLVRVEVWDVPRRDRIASFDCALSQFGMRLAVADTDLGPIVVAGAWGVPGVRGYEHGTGETSGSVATSSDPGRSSLAVSKASWLSHSVTDRRRSLTRLTAHR